MLRKQIKKILLPMLIVFFLLSTNGIAIVTTKEKTSTLITIDESDDYDPLVDIEVTVTIKEIRALDKIDKIGDPDFYVKIFINDVEHASPVWKNQKYVKQSWSATENVPDDERDVHIIIQLWDQNKGCDKLCDISNNGPWDPDSHEVELWYDIASGYWGGDDYYTYWLAGFDPSGYGRLNGCDDNSIYQNDLDCEIWFDITQTDPDGDGIPYCMETDVYSTDPEQNDTGMDFDNDEIPIEWEWKWRYDPKKYDDHRNLDHDMDGLDNVEEYLTSQWNSDPFRKDLFIEIDQMELGPNGEGAVLPEGTKDLLTDAYAKHNIAYHFDDGCMGGGEFIPFNENVSRKAGDLQDIYFEYFLNNNSSHWRRGVFHYGLIDYYCHEYAGFVFGTTADGENYSLDSFQISITGHEEFPFEHPLFCMLKRQTINKEKQRAIVYAGAIMHETGHTLGLFGGYIGGIDNKLSVFPRIQWLRYINYRSCMNYNYAYYLVDYSDGSRGKNDHDDWGNLDLTFFEKDLRWH